MSDSIIQDFEQRQDSIGYPALRVNGELINEVTSKRGVRGLVVHPRGLLNGGTWACQAVRYQAVRMEAIRRSIVFRTGLDLERWSLSLPLFWSTEGLWTRTPSRKNIRKSAAISGGKVHGPGHGRPPGLLTDWSLSRLNEGQFPPLLGLTRTSARRLGRDRPFRHRTREWVKLFWRDMIEHDRASKGSIRMGDLERTDHGVEKRRLRCELHVPREGATGRRSFVTSGARNIDQAYAFVNFVLRADVNGRLASVSGRHPVSVGAEHYLWDSTHEAFDEAYPLDAAERFWWEPPLPLWYAAARARYRDEFLAALEGVEE